MPVEVGSGKAANGGDLGEGCLEDDKRQGDANADTDANLNAQEQHTKEGGEPD
jgi:hypothetical protein